ncbi:unnamed protein product (macronuclear) [Paramecium tetraurelia]|uniref:Uncharacterized protein n=1 Tax=Paramecium tetraurelia TaxID=5888 RepID=A0DFG6_PARTE|nr:uncharacterized protein GSPATT00016596001 [Paramecium tetraurelia]CAK81783.1 unnamed protein product [Paramecium tetraurelia]|eukprot:XP_001449180.1 hypothetical protein (macronuclear) [Paramecium tetraurelia strain d4-2]
MNGHSSYAIRIVILLKGGKRQQEKCRYYLFSITGIGVCLSIGALPNQGKNVKKQKDVIKQLHKQPEEHNHLI